MGTVEDMSLKCSCSIRFSSLEEAEKMTSEACKEIPLEIPIQVERQIIDSESLHFYCKEKISVEDLKKIKEHFNEFGCHIVKNMREGGLLCFMSEEQRDAAYEKMGGEMCTIDEINGQLEKGLFPSWHGRKRKREPAPIKEDLDKEMENYKNQITGQPGDQITGQPGE